VVFLIFVFNTKTINLFLGKGKVIFQDIANVLQDRESFIFFYITEIFVYILKNINTTVY